MLNLCPDMIDFVIYRPDIMYEKLRLDFDSKTAEIDVIRKVKSKIHTNLDSILNDSWVMGDSLIENLINYES